MGPPSNRISPEKKTSNKLNKTQQPQKVTTPTSKDKKNVNNGGHGSKPHGTRKGSQESGDSKPVVSQTSHPEADLLDNTISDSDRSQNSKTKGLKPGSKRNSKVEQQDDLFKTMPPPQIKDDKKLEVGTASRNLDE